MKKIIVSILIVFGGLMAVAQSGPGVSWKRDFSGTARLLMENTDLVDGCAAFYAVLGSDTLKFSICQDSARIESGSVPLAINGTTWPPSSGPTIYTENGSVANRVVTVDSSLVFQNDTTGSLIMTDDFGPLGANLAGSYIDEGGWLILSGVHDLNGPGAGSIALNPLTGEFISNVIAKDFKAAGASYFNPSIGHVATISLDSGKVNISRSKNGTSFYKIIMIDSLNSFTNPLSNAVGKSQVQIFSRDNVEIDARKNNRGIVDIFSDSLVNIYSVELLKIESDSITIRPGFNPGSPGDVLTSDGASVHWTDLQDIFINNSPPAYADDVAAGLGGLTAGKYYQTTGAGAAPLNAPGILMIKQ